MNNRTIVAVSGLFAGLLLSSFSSLAAGGGRFEVTITNLTRGQTLTPILVASHRRGVKLFTLGEEASDALAALAEGGDVVPLTTEFEADPLVIEVTDSGGLLGPGETVTVTVGAGYGARNISLASMMIHTNDAFIALNGVQVPWGHRAVTYFSSAYDAGSEPNDELCDNIPGPVCGGDGGSPDAGGEDYVHIHGGIHGIGDLTTDTYDWRNPVAKIMIRRVR